MMPEPVRPDLDFVDRKVVHDIVWSSKQNVETDAVGRVVVPEGLVSFSAVETLLTTLCAHLDGLPDDLRTQYGEHLAQTVPSLVGHLPRQSGHFYNADTLGSAVVRRISRESVHLSDAIDGLARLVPELLNRVARDHGAFVLTLSRAERIDRPSARVFYRVTQLARKPLRWTWEFHEPVFLDSSAESGDPISWRFLRARHRLFTFLAEELGPNFRSMPSGPAYLPSLPSTAIEVDRAVAVELVGQNYDLAYLRAGGLSPGTTSETTANVYRMLCIVDANLGEIDSASESIGKALEKATTPQLRAHCRYMSGLLFTKRQYDLDTADEHYRLGLASLGNADDDESVLERAWLTNGRSLVRALRSKALPVRERDDLVKQVFVEEVNAFKSVALQDSSQALYLQLNLLANLTLLLEINRDYSRAAHFWSQVFDRFRGNSTEEQRSFEVAFRYRLGMLLSKADQHEEAWTHLAEAVALASSRQQRFTYQRTLYALGYIEYQAGRPLKALATFTAAATLAAELRDIEALLNAGLGARAAAGELGLTVDELYWSGAINRVSSAHPELAETASSDKPPMPPPKFPSYIPLIDLEATPIVDLNRFLANDHSEVGLDRLVQEQRTVGRP